MTQEDKELLLIDLSARLSYGVKGIVYAETTNGRYDIYGKLVYFDVPFDTILDTINITTKEIHVVAIGDEDTVDFIEDQQNYDKPYFIGDFKPYLRPMSSMTKKERKEYEKTCFFSNEIGTIATLESADWLNKHHFDYRGLIEKGLALEAPENMYKNN